MSNSKQSMSDAEYFAPLIVKHATDSMVFTDPEGLTIWANAPFTQMSGYAVEEIIGQKPGAILQGADTDPETVTRIRHAVRTRQTIRTELLNYTRDGSPYWIDLTITPVYDDAGVLTHFMSIERDITERKLLAEKTSAALEAERMRRQERRVLSKMSEWLFATQSLTELKQVVSRSMVKLFPETYGALYIYSNSRDVLEWAIGWGDTRCEPYLKAEQC